ncbi:mitochondrial inner membrane protein required for protein import [Phlyctochytrium bullatum]|nr:mitochondrial inner membrane protein required for protein import [Phlyctochytrium bullatum]
MALKSLIAAMRLAQRPWEGLSRPAILSSCMLGRTPAMQFSTITLAERTHWQGSTHALERSDALGSRFAISHQQTRTFRVKSSSTTTNDQESNPKPSSSTAQSQASGASKGPEDSSSEAAASEGMDLFSRALAAQRRKQQQEAEAAAAAGSTQAPPSGSNEGANAGSGGYSGFRGPEDAEEPLSPEEEERLRRLRERAEAEEGKVVAKRGRLLLAVSGAAVALAYGFLGLPGKDESYGSFADHNKRAVSNLRQYGSLFHAPPPPKLLPDPLPEGYQPRNTLFIELNDVLVHMTWDKDLGWRAALRPGMKKFLAYLSRFYEIVIFTNSHNYLAAPVLETIDPFHYYKRYALYRDSTRRVKGHYVKDLSLTNRDLNSCIIVDSDPKNFQLQPENGVLIKPWQLEKGDKELEKLMGFLEEIAWLREIMQYSDIRKILDRARKEDADDLVNGWSIAKQKIRADFYAKFNPNHQDGTDATAAPQTTLGAITNSVSQVVGQLFGRGLKNVVAPAGGPGALGHSGIHPGDLVGVLEFYSKLEREAFEKEFADKLQEIEDLKRQQIEEIEKQMQQMKEKKMTLKDYMSIGGMPPPGGPDGQQPQPLK